MEIVNQDANEEVMQGNDKFMIKAFISHKKLTDVIYIFIKIDETKKMITQEDLQSPLTQALFLMTTFSQDKDRISLNPQKSVNQGFTIRSEVVIWLQT